MTELGRSSLPEVLAPRDEAEWERFRALLEYATGFWLAFVFAPSSLEAAVFRQRVTEILAAQGEGRMDVFLPQSPDELQQALPWMLSPDRAGAGCVWVQALQVDGAGREQQPWADAWAQVFLRTNERREVLRQQMRGGLVLVAPVAMKVMVRDAAPDLWSIRSLVLELSGETAARRGGDWRAEPLRLAEEQRETTTAPDPAFWMEEAQRRKEGSEGRAFALLQAALGWAAEKRFTDALVPIVEAVTIHRQLAAQDAEGSRAGLARSLHVLSRIHGELGDHERGISCAREAVDLFRQLAAEHPDTFLPELAESLHDLSHEHLSLDESAAALGPTQEAVNIRRTLAAQNPDAFLPRLMIGLLNLGTCQWNLDQFEAALASTREAVDICRKFAAQDPDAFLPLLALGLHNQGAIHNDLGEYEAALASTHEAVNINRRLAAKDPEAFLSYLAINLFNLSLWYLNLDRHAEALPVAQEAFDLHWRLHQGHPEAFRELTSQAAWFLLEIHRKLGTLPDPETVARIALISPPDPQPRRTLS